MGASTQTLFNLQVPVTRGLKFGLGGGGIYKIYILKSTQKFKFHFRMIKTLRMVSHKKFKINANEYFVMFLTSELITCFIDTFTSGVKSQSIASLLSGSTHTHTHIGFWTLRVKCTQYGICE